MTWDDLHFWDLGDYQWIQEQLEDLDAKGIRWNPGRTNMYRALDLCPFDRVKVIILGQDPYPNIKYCTGLCFGVPSLVRSIPASLATILVEYQTDLHYPYPKSGDLSAWCKQGVLLWNCYPTCESGKPLSHRWQAWELLTQELLSEVSKQTVVVIALGTIAKSFVQYVDTSSAVIETSHPAPRGRYRTQTPFVGSRIFTRANGLLCQKGLEPVDWRLP